jgi:hypothetical protein
MWMWFLLHWTEIYWMSVMCRDSICVWFYKGNYKSELHKHSMQLQGVIILSKWSLINCIGTEPMLTNKPAVHLTSDGPMVDGHLSMYDSWDKPVFTTSSICKLTHQRQNEEQVVCMAVCFVLLSSVFPHFYSRCRVRTEVPELTFVIQELRFLNLLILWGWWQFFKLGVTVLITSFYILSDSLFTNYCTI